MKSKYAIGADIGGSHISTVLIDLGSKRIIESSFNTERVDHQAAADEIIKSWATSIQETMGHVPEGGMAGVGFAMPGPFDYANGISLMDKSVAKYESIYGLNVGDAMKKVLGLPESMPFRYINDALAFAIGECWIGQASGYWNVMAITLGTGFGSAFLTSGVPVIEGNRVPEKGYVYHIPYREGIADDYFSTRWLVSEFQLRTGLVCRGVKEIYEKCSVLPEANGLMQEFGHDLGKFLLPLLNKFEADCLLIGGNIAGAYPIFGPALVAALNQQDKEIVIVISELMESAAMIGSARLLEETFWKQAESLVSKI